MQWNPRSITKMIVASVAVSALFSTTAAAQVVQPEPPKIIRKSGGVLQGAATRRVEPTYPPLAKAAKVSGSVVVEVTVDETGSIISARPISGHPLLKDAAVAAARGWKFKPTLLEGVAVKVIGTITFNFNLGDPSDDSALRELEKQVAANPESPELLHKLGIAYRRAFLEDKAIEVLKLAIELKPDLLEAYDTLGRAS